MVQERQEPAEVGLLLDAGRKMPAREGFAEALCAPAIFFGDTLHKM